MDLNKIKDDNEHVILDLDGVVCDWLPTYELTQMRTQQEIINRALIMNAMINIAFNAPIEHIKNYINDNSLTGSLSDDEAAILELSQDSIEEQDKVNLHWYLESLWSLIWVMNKFDELNINEPIPDDMIDYCPNLQNEEGPEKFTHNIQLRSFEEIYVMRDLYYRAMWCARDFNLHTTPHANFNMSIIMERRRGLTWCLDKESDWDNIPQDT
ncbi:DUF4272 domain-containing protein [Pseudoalteromonas carrageenovora]|uniref:DUF4272 domain-containing protein n=1 Tax=Pseudoalteromonas carrageenovora TaxID=227 RepID=UPI00311E6DD1